MRDPEFIIFTGPMFGSKTTRLLAAVDRYRYQNKKIIAFKPVMDNRYSSSEISTHSGGRLGAIGVNSGECLLEYIKNNSIDFDVVAVAESCKEETTTVFPAVCPITGRDAYYTHRKFEGDEITVGGSDLYEPRCWEHHSFMNQFHKD